MRREIGKFGISDKRGRVYTNEDPYAAALAMKGTVSCDSCPAIYSNKRWQLLPETSSLPKGEIRKITCPTCRKIADNYPEGVITLRGEYLWEHEEEIRRILKNEERRAVAKNPGERIIRMDQIGDSLIIETTEEKLAEHLGRVLHRAHHGALQVSWGSDHTMCRVTWER